MKRLKTLKAVRPPWIDDYEKMETEVATLYADYLDKFRNVAYLEDQIEVSPLIDPIYKWSVLLLYQTNVISRKSSKVNRSPSGNWWSRYPLPCFA